MSDEAKFSDLLGKTLISIEGGAGSDEVVFRCSDGSVFKQYHSQDCCEHVTVESIVGDVADLLGTPILVAEESTSGETPAGYEHEYEPESVTWTFYKLRTFVGSLDIRWLGESNGYYSESVEFVRVAALPA